MESIVGGPRAFRVDKGAEGREPPTCLAAIASFGMPQPWRKQLASSKMANTSSPLAAPPFLSPACKAKLSTVAALDAAAERYCTAPAGSGAHPHPCLELQD